MPMFRLILLILALVCFALRALEVQAPRVDLTALGLAFWVLSVLIGMPV